MVDFHVTDLLLKKDIATAIAALVKSNSFVFLEIKIYLKNTKITNHS